MEVLFIGSVFLDEDEAKKVVCNSKGPAQSAANAVQWALIHGLDKHNGKPVTVLSSSPVGLFPRYYPEAVVKSRRWSHACGVEDESVGFVNIPILKHLTRSISLSIRSARWAVRPSIENKVVVVYSIHSPFLLAAAVAKLVNHRVRICLIAPDLPQFMNLNMRHGVPYRILKMLDHSILAGLLRAVDGFAFFATQMANVITPGHRPWVVMEGLADPGDLKIVRTSNEDLEGKKIILYAGALGTQYGILDLIEAFKLIDDTEFELWVCGSGDGEDAIKTAQAMDSRIRWLGQINRSQVLELEAKATVLVNPRNPRGDYTRYSFPSKTIEYMLSGVPVVMYRLPGIPPEYEPWIQWIDEEGVLGMARKIREVCALSEEHRRLLGEGARQFILKNKDYVTQSERVYGILQQITVTDLEQGVKSIR